MRNAIYKIRMRRVALTLLWLCVTRAFGGDAPSNQLVNQKLGDLDRANLPVGWSVAEPDKMSSVDEAGRGKVLKIANSDEKSPSVEFALHPARAAGKALTVTLLNKFPGKYAKIADKPEAAPKLLLESKDDAGRPVGSEVLYLNEGKPEWQTLKKAVVIPAGSASVVAKIVVPKVACEVFFDTLLIELNEPAAVAAPTPPPVTVPTPTPAAPKPAPVAAPVPPPAAPAVPSGDPKKDIAAKATKRSLDDGGIQFGPEEAARLQADASANKATAYAVLAIGPGFAEKEAFKFSGNWKPLPVTANLAGAKAQPRELLALLPDVLVKVKPEVVLISTDATGARKATSTEAEDWEDVARLCERFGAAPVLMTTPIAEKTEKGEKDKKDENQDVILAAIRKVRDLNNLPVVYLKPAETLSKRISVCLNLFETFVFLRNKPEDPATAKPKPKQTDE